jgi:hypothetical protein
MLRTLLLVLVLLVLAGALRAQDEPYDEVELRVTNSRPGIAIIDRGSTDGLAVRDRIVFHPRGGGAKQGTVTRVEERNAVVELAERALELAPGTKGTVRIPRSRGVAPVADEPTPTATSEPQAQETQPPQQHPEWRNRDQDWKRGDPLLAKVTPLRPEQRPATITGRFYSIGDAIHSSEDHRSDLFVRAGADVEYDNLFGGGETLHLDGELNYRQTEVPDDEDEVARRLRIDRASYAIGGTRFRPTRFEVGRFLQNGMPEFGVVDGAEWNRRSSGGDRYGVSAGFMPEPDEDYHTGDDFQLAGFYRWVSDETEQLAFSSGFQKSFHHGAADRDLFVLDVDYLPDEGWTFFGTAWLDWYTDGDDAKGPGLSPTQVIADLGRRYDDGSAIDFVYTHLEFPEMDRNEFRPVTLQQLEDDHAERLALRGNAPVAQRAGMFGEIAGWLDEDDAGGDGELGFSFDDWLVQRSSTDFAVFGVRGSSVTSVGARASFDTYGPGGGWRFDYELANNRSQGFTDDNDDLIQHRARVTRDVESSTGWSFSAYFELGLWDAENSLAGGFYLQKSF